MRALVRILPLAVVAALAAAVAAGCGGVQLDPVARAATKTANAGSFRFDAQLSFSSPQAKAQKASLTGRYDADAKRLAVTLAAGEGQIDAVADLAAEPALYVKLPFAKGWLKLDVEKAAQEHDLGDLSPAQWNPQELLSSLKEVGDSTKVGEEELDGVRTTHYRVDVDPKKLIEKQPEAQRKAAEKGLEQSGIDTVPVDVWIGDDDLLRRISLHLDGSGATPFSLEARLDLSGYGGDVHVDLPPADEVLGGTR
jgi:hypothetical protein